MFALPIQKEHLGRFRASACFANGAHRHISNIPQIAERKLTAYRSSFESLGDTLWITDDIPSYIIRNVPAQLMNQEKALYYKIAMHFYTFSGDIIDAGCLLGGTTNCLAFGVLANRRLVSIRGTDIRPIKVFDKFENDPTVIDLVQSRYGQTLSRGGSFRHIFEMNTRFISSLIDVYDSDIMNVEYNTESFAEILSLDLCKGPALTRRSYVMFLPHTRPSTSILIHQDYVHAWQPMIHWSMEYLRPFYTPVLQSGFSQVYFCRATPTQAALDEVCAADYPVSSKLSLYEKAIEGAPNLHTAIFMSIARCRMVAEEVDPDEAESMLQTLVSNTPEASQYMDQIDRMKAFIKGLRK